MMSHANDRKPGKFWDSIITLVIIWLMSGCGSSTTIPVKIPIDFVLNNSINFSLVNGINIVEGVTAHLNFDSIKQNVVSTFQHTLFVLNRNTTISVYTDGSSSAIPAKTSKKDDGSIIISYSHSSKSGSTTFNGILIKDQMSATYITEDMLGTVVNGQTFSGGSTSTATFTTLVHWVSPDQIPTAPTNGRYQFTSDGGVTLIWSGSAKEYTIYRFVLIDKRGFQFLAKASSTSYLDESQITRSNARTVTAIAYSIYAVGPTGIENPGCIMLSL